MILSNDKMIYFVKRWRELEKQQRELDYNKSQWCKELRAEFRSGDTGDEQFVNWCSVELGLTAGQAKELLLRAVAATTVPDVKTWNAVGGFKAIAPLAELPKRDQVTVIEKAKSTGYSVGTILKRDGYVKPLPPLAPTPSRAAVDHRAVQDAEAARRAREQEQAARAKQLRDIEEAKRQADIARAAAARELEAARKAKAEADAATAKAATQVALVKKRSPANDVTDAHSDAVVLAKFIAGAGLKNIPRDVLKVISKYLTSASPSGTVRRKTANA